MVETPRGPAVSTPHHPGILKLVPLRIWALLISVLTVGLGGILVQVPIRELAAAKGARPEHLVAIGSLLTGTAMILGGLGIFLRVGGYRKYMGLAVCCTLPMALIYGFETVYQALRLRGANGVERTGITEAIQECAQLGGLFFASGVGLLMFFRGRPLRPLGFRPGAGMLGCAVFGLIQGVAAGFLVWWCISRGTAAEGGAGGGRVLEFFVVTGGLIGTLSQCWIGGRRRSPPLAPMDGAFTCAVGGGVAGYVVWQVGQWLADSYGIAWLGTSSPIPFVIVAVVLFSGIAVIHGFQARYADEAEYAGFLSEGGPAEENITTVRRSRGPRDSRQPRSRPAAGAAARPPARSAAEPTRKSGVHGARRGATRSVAGRSGVFDTHPRSVESVPAPAANPARPEAVDALVDDPARADSIDAARALLASGIWDEPGAVPGERRSAAPMPGIQSHLVDTGSE